MRNQKAYRQLSEHMIEWPFYLKDWWLDATCTPAGWDAVVINTNGDGEPDAVLPYEVRRKWGFRKVSTPEFTPWSGPWLKDTQRHKAHHIMAEFEALMTSIFDDLPRSRKVDIKLSPDIPYGLPAHWAGFRESLMYTYRLSFNEAKNAFDNFNRSTRKEVQSFDAELFTPDGDEFFHFISNSNSKYTTAQHRKLERIHSALQERERLVIRAARENDTWLGAVMGVIDREELFLLCSGLNRSVKPNFAFYAIIFDIIKRHEGRINTIDFMGSQDPSVAHSFRSLGAIPMSIRRIEKKSLLNF